MERERSAATPTPTEGLLALPIDGLGEIQPGDDLPATDGAQIRERLERELELVLDAGSCGIEMTTVIDLTRDPPEITRQGRGSAAVLGNR